MAHLIEPELVRYTQVLELVVVSVECPGLLPVVVKDWILVSDSLDQSFESFNLRLILGICLIMDEHYRDSDHNTTAFQAYWVVVAPGSVLTLTMILVELTEATQSLVAEPMLLIGVREMSLTVGVTLRP
jgi:hypothetical protein